MRVIQLFVCIFVLGISSLYGSLVKDPLSATSAILINAETGKVLFQKNGYAKKYPASLVKVATFLYVLQQSMDLEEKVKCYGDPLKRISPKKKVKDGYTAPPYYIEWDGTVYGILSGEILSIENLLYGMMLPSGNDAANCLADHYGDTIIDFCRDMTAFLKKIGCKNTQLLNPNGLHHPEQYSTAYDLALITKMALTHPIFRKVVSTTSYERPKTNRQKAKMVYQHNRLLLPNSSFFYRGAIGVKTGYMSHAKNNVIAAAERGDRKLIAVSLNCNTSAQRFRDCITMFDAAFSEEKQIRPIFHKDEEEYTLQKKEARKPIRGRLLEDVYIEYYPSEEPKVTANIKWNETSLPIKKGDMIGCLVVKDEAGDILQSTPIIADQDVKKKVGYMWKLLVLLLACGVIFTIYLFRNFNKDS